MATTPARAPRTPRVPLDIWFLILDLLTPRDAWRARLTCASWRFYVESHLSLLWFRHACVEAKLAPFFRIYDTVAPSIRDPYPCRKLRGKWAGFDRPETGEMEGGAWSWSAGGGGSGGGTSTPGGSCAGGRGMNLTKSLWLHKEVTVSLALCGEVSQPLKLKLRILSTNGDADEGVDGEGEPAAWAAAAGAGGERSGSCSPCSFGDEHLYGHGRAHSPESDRPSPSASPEPEPAMAMATALEEPHVRAMYLSANGRRIRFDWKLLMERASRQGNWSPLPR